MKNTPILNETKRILKISWKEFVYKILISVVVRGLALVIPILWSNAINDVSKSAFGSGSRLIVWVLLLTVLYYISEMVNQYFYYLLHRKLYREYTSLAVTSTSNNSIYSLSRFSLGEYTNILNYDIDIISTYFSNLVIRVVKMLEFVVIYWYFLDINFNIFIVTVILSIVMLAVLLISGKRTQIYNARRKNDLDRKTAVVHETFNGIKEIKGFNVFKNMEDRIMNSCNGYLKSNTRYNTYFIYIKSGVQMIIEIVRYLLIFYGIYLVTNGNMELGTVLIIHTYYGKIIENFDIIAYINAEFKDLKVSLSRFNKILEYQYDPRDMKYVPRRDYKGQITFKNVIYGNREDPILNNVSFEIPGNAITVITGKAGSGKTGIFDLLLKMNRKHEGIIKIDDDDIEKIRNDVCYNLMSLVRKDPVFFDLSIKDNLLLIDNDFEKAKHICKLLHVDDDIENLSNGYDTMLNSKSENISNNIRQLIAIARVLLKNSKIMMFDDTLSILDTNSEEYVLDILDSLKSNHTIIIISREEEVLKRADVIITLEENKVLSVNKKKKIEKK